ncbi:hemolysin family protein [Mycoplasmopsis ciconiae]|uniref:Hemolysin family protein n=1 Tax=Mycoplasmopsis ciconiae TaxID=561067 RepID=A0ABU7MKZ4_9BACT|nr:hemolysin family protein [Mycoplasmopsis ciconiae]
MSLALEITFFVLVVLLFIFSSIFSGSETAYTSISAAKIQQMVDNKERFSHLIQKQYKNYNATLSTILIGNNIVNVASSTITSAILSIWLTDHNSTYIPLISTVLVTPILVIFGEILPKLLAKNKPEIFLKTFCILIEVFYWCFFWVVIPISKLGKKVYITNSEDELKTMVDIAKDEGVLQSAESLLVQKALDLDSTKVSSHYVRLKNVEFLDYKANIQQALDMFKETNYSRLPVMKNSQLIGIVLLKDIFNLQKGKIINYLKTVPYVSANSTLSSAMDKMRIARAQMAFVIENNNSSDVIGIITIEDILEELVGEIYDETDEEENIFEINLEKSRVYSTTPLKNVFKQLELDNEDISDQEWEMTIGKWLLLKTQRQRLTKNTRYTLDRVATFKVIQTKTKDVPHSLIEINKI